ncbi:Hypothetical Protein U712_18340 [Bacillus subtilis PY79]|nr:Hypothetical Protein U712_18340 [Bacillus subtilis PY79]EME07861.1 hypothetical protein BS732_0599 [Bacillus subtilis MB73/2]
MSIPFSAHMNSFFYRYKVLYRKKCHSPSFPSLDNISQKPCQEILHENVLSFFFLYNEEI